MANRIKRNYIFIYYFTLDNSYIFTHFWSDIMIPEMFIGSGVTLVMLAIWESPDSNFFLPIWVKLFIGIVFIVLATIYIAFARKK